MPGLSPEKGGVEAARGIATAACISVALWAGLIALPVLVI